MKYVYSAVLLMTLSTTMLAQETSELSLPPNGDNERSEVSQWIGPVKILIDYHSPHVHNPATNDRTGHIWGELVHYGFFDEGFGPTKAAPWRAGANESTSITLSNDVKIEVKDLKAGTYALFLDVEEKGPWYWVVSSHVGWGSYQYDPKNDALRVSVNPETALYTEFMTYGFDQRRPNLAVAYLQWEEKRVPFRIDVPNGGANPNPTGFALAGTLRVARGKCPCAPLPLVPIPAATAGPALMGNLFEQGDVPPTGD